MIATLLTAIALSTPADWSKVDTAMLSVLAIESMYDVANTRYRLLHPQEGLEDLPNRRFDEINPLLGSNPSPLRLWGTFAVAIATAFVISYFLPITPRRLAEGAMLGGESVNLARNAIQPGYVVWKVAF